MADTPQAREFFALRKAEFALYRQPKPRDDLRPYVILAHYRSGTTLLTELLERHPDVHCAGEILLDYLEARPRWVLFPKAFVLRRAAKTGTPVGGVTLRTDQLHACLLPWLPSRPAAFIRSLARDGWKFIHLVRENALHQALSNIEAHARQDWHFRTGQSLPREALHVDPKRLIGSAFWGEGRRKAETEALTGVEHLSVIYERDLLDGSTHQSTMDRIFEFLGAPSHPVQASLKKIGTRSLAERIANYDEVLAALRGTSLERYLSKDERSTSD